MVSSPAYAAARERAGLIERSDRGRIVVSGADRASYLQGLLTNDVAALKSGEGCYAAYLTPQGRMIADLLVYELGDAMLVTVPRAQTETVLKKLDQFVFSEDVQLGDVTETFSTLAVVGPEAGRVLSRLLPIDVSDLEGLAAHANRRTQFDGRPSIITRIIDTGELGYDVYVERGQADALRQTLLAAGVVEIDPATADVLRIEAGVPKFTHDMDEETIPLEAGIESRAISFSKGCYVGQEVIIRVLHRGHGRVARKLVGLVLDAGSAPQPGTTVTADAREIGRVTSSAVSPKVGHAIALAYLHRDFITAGTTVSVAGQAATVTALPFVRTTGTMA